MASPRKRSKATTDSKTPRQGTGRKGSKGAKKKTTNASATIPVQRVQTGVRMERRILKVLKGLAEYYDMSLGDLLEGIVLHAFEGRSPFDASAIERIDALKKVYELELDASASHRLSEQDER